MTFISCGRHRNSLFAIPARMNIFELYSISRITCSNEPARSVTHAQPSDQIYLFERTNIKLEQ